MADAVQVAYQSGRKSRVDGGDLIILLYKYARAVSRPVPVS